ncbi:MAG: hypothetical protein HWN68_17470 [Desulfobacterales bacterium]|nr:hypothetical protein [Desulfobacterales bacterium]
MSYEKAMKGPVFDPIAQTGEFLQYAPNVLDKALLIPAVGVLEAEMPLAAGKAWPIRRVPKSTYRVLYPYAISGVAAAQRSEKAEAHVAGLGDVDYDDGECLCYSEKELITRKAMTQLGYPLLNYVTMILVRMVNLPIEKAVVDAMVAATCQTAASEARWDAASGVVITKDIEKGRRALASKGFPRRTHVLILSGYDYSSVILYLESKGFMGLTYETSLEFVAKYLNIPVLLEENAIGATGAEVDILSDTAILCARGQDWGAIVESVGLNIRTWRDENLDGTWVEVSRECEPKRILGDSIYTITNTVS